MRNVELSLEVGKDKYRADMLLKAATCRKNYTHIFSKHSRPSGRG